MATRNGTFKRYNSATDTWDVINLATTIEQVSGLTQKMEKLDQLEYLVNQVEMGHVKRVDFTIVLDENSFKGYPIYNYFSIQFPSGFTYDIQLAEFINGELTLTNTFSVRADKVRLFNPSFYNSDETANMKRSLIHNLSSSYDLEDTSVKQGASRSSLSSYGADIYYGTHTISIFVPNFIDTALLSATFENVEAYYPSGFTYSSGDKLHGFKAFTNSELYEKVKTGVQHKTFVGLWDTYDRSLGESITINTPLTDIGLTVPSSQEGKDNSFRARMIKPKSPLFVGQYPNLGNRLQSVPNIQMVMAFSTTGKTSIVFPNRGTVTFKIPKQWFLDNGYTNQFWRPNTVSIITGGGADLTRSAGFVLTKYFIQRQHLTNLDIADFMLAGDGFGALQTEADNRRGLCLTRTSYSGTSGNTGDVTVKLDILTFDSTPIDMAVNQNWRYYLLLTPVE